MDSSFVPSAGQDLDGVLRGISIVGELFFEQVVVARRLTVGGVVYAQTMFEPQLEEIEWGGQEGEPIEFDGTSMLMAGPTAAFRFSGGAYVTASAGVLWWSTRRGKARGREVTVEPHDGPGIALMPGIGYEWLGVDRSVGVLLQIPFGWVNASDDAGTEWNYRLFLPAVTVTLAFH